MDPLHDVAAALLELTSSLEPDESREHLLLRVATRMVEVVPDADAVTVTLYDRDAPATVAATEPSLVALDEAQYRAEDGPCLRAVRSASVVRTEIDLDRFRWPALLETAVAHGIRTSLSCPLFVAEDGPAARRRAAELGLAGALNVWSRRRGAFDPVGAALVAMFTSAAAAVILTAARWRAAESQIRGLLAALDSRDLIATAKGVVMARLEVDQEVAFKWLTDVSQRTNRKVRELAVVIVADPGLVRPR
ncbi:MAG: hypothetical protein QOI78_8945 [Actinomycetota bacterium]|jgi:hypothetical protein|nr:hypothetical protein [Actinomycetota bacterium]